MGSVYTAQSIANYNQNPPADDGSSVPSNQITWAKHKTKLADPIKTLSEAINTELVTAFGKVDGGITAVNDDYTVLANDQGKVVVQSGASKTITTPAAGTVTAPFRFAVVNIHASSDLTLDGNASETIDGSATVTIPAGRGLIIDTDGANWFTYGQNWPTGVLIDLLGLTYAQGDVIYYDGSNLTNLGPGTSGQFLKTNGAGANPAWADAGLWTEIDNTTIASAQADYTLTGLSAYAALRVHIRHILPATDNVNLFLRTSTDNGASYDSGAADYGWFNDGGRTGDGNASEGDDSDNDIKLHGTNTVGNAAAEGASCTIDLMNFNQTEYLMAQWQTGLRNISGAFGCWNGHGRRLSTTARDAFQIRFSSGNIAEARIIVDGRTS